MSVTPNALRENLSEVRIGASIIRVDRLCSLEAMDAVADEWRALEQKCDEHFTYFQTFDWCRNWCAVHLPGDKQHDLRIFTVSVDNLLVAVLPLVHEQSVRWLNHLVPVGHPLSQYSGVLCDTDRFTSAIQKSAWQVIGKHVEADCLQLDHFAKGGTLDRMIGDSGYAERSTFCSSIQSFDRLEDWETYRSGLTSSVRKGRNKRRNKLAKLGSLKFEVCPAGSDEYRRLIALAIAMKLEWLQGNGRRTSVLSNPDTLEFLCRLTSTPANDTMPVQGAVASALSLNGRPIAIEIGFGLGTHFYSFLGAFDTEFQSYSPGKVQIEDAMKWALESGYTKYDFLADPAAYKHAWTDEKHPLLSRSLPGSLRGHVYCLLWKTYTRPALLSLFNRLGPKTRQRLLGVLGMKSNDSQAPAVSSGKFGAARTGQPQTRLS